MRDLPKPFIKWAGGKSQLLPTLLGFTRAAGPFDTYIEPFLGSGALFLALRRCGWTGQAVLNDQNQYVANAWRKICFNVGTVITALTAYRDRHNESLYYQTRADFNMRGLKGYTVKRAAQFIYLNKTCFNGLWRMNRKGEFNVPIGRYKNPRIFDEENLIAVSNAMHNGHALTAHVCNTDFTAVTPPSTGSTRRGLYYLDPPYHPLSKTSSFTAYTKDGFDEQKQTQLRDTCVTIDRAGQKFILSNSATPFILELYKQFAITIVQSPRRINCKGDKRDVIDEVIVTNF